MSLFFVLCSLFFPLSQVSAQSIGDIAQSKLSGSFIGGTGVSTASLGDTIAASVTIILGMLGIIFFILAVYAGFLWTTAEGDEGKIGEAKQTIIRASLGFFVVISSYALTAFITGQLVVGSRAGDGPQPDGPPGPIGCCLDRVSATGRPGPTGLGVWADRMATEFECSTMGNDPNDPGDVRYGEGTWEWIGEITPDTPNYVDACEARRAAK